jgi:hypothetical protein
MSEKRPGSRVERGLFLRFRSPLAHGSCRFSEDNIEKYTVKHIHNIQTFLPAFPYPRSAKRQASNVTPAPVTPKKFIFLQRNIAFDQNRWVW